MLSVQLSSVKTMHILWSTSVELFPLAETELSRATSQQSLLSLSSQPLVVTILLSIFMNLIILDISVESNNIFKFVACFTYHNVFRFSHIIACDRIFFF